MQKVFVFRHTKSVKNDLEVARARALLEMRDRDFPLSGQGLDEASTLCRRIVPYFLSRGLSGPVRLVHSPYRRTRQTADFIFIGLKSLEVMDKIRIVSVSDDERLADHDNGLAFGLTHEEARERFPGYARDMDEYPRAHLDAVPPGGESKRECIERVRSFLYDARDMEESLVIVTHLDPIIYLMALSEGLESEERAEDRMLQMLSNQKLRSSTGTVTFFQRRQADGRLALQESFLRLV